MAEGDTRLYESWQEKYRDKEKKKKINPGNICLFTEVKDGYYNYEGTNLLVGCDHANTYRGQVSPKVEGTYGGPKVSWFF